MKFITFTSILLIAAAFFCAAALCQPPGPTDAADPGAISDNTRPQGISRKPPPPKGPAVFIADALHRKMVLSALCHVTGMDSEAMLAELETRKPREILEAYGIEKETFASAMDAEAIGIAQSLLDCGVINQEAFAAIAEKIENRPQAPAETI